MKHEAMQRIMVKLGMAFAQSRSQSAAQAQSVRWQTAELGCCPKPAEFLDSSKCPFVRFARIGKRAIVASCAAWDSEGWSSCVPTFASHDAAKEKHARGFATTVDRP